METNNAAVGAILFIILVFGVNFFIYDFMRGNKGFLRKIAKAYYLVWGIRLDLDDKGFLETLRKSLNASQLKEKTENPMEELHSRVEDLKKGKKGN